jgi:hypothetical protein
MPRPLFVIMATVAAALIMRRALVVIMAGALFAIT